MKIHHTVLLKTVEEEHNNLNERIMGALFRFFNSYFFGLLRFEGQCVQFSLVTYSSSFSEGWFKMKAWNIVSSNFIQLFILALRS